MAIPIIFVHKGNPYFLRAVLEQAKRTNPCSEIILLGDETNKSFSFVRHFCINDYFESAEEFSKVYQHHSPNPFGYELFCFQRWFVLNDFVEKELGADSQFFYCDTDTLLFEDLSSEFQKYNKYDMTICRTGTPCFTFFNVGVIKKFAKFIFNRYATAEGKRMISAYVKDLKAKQRRYGISDMTAFSAYEYAHPSLVLRVDLPYYNYCFCHNILDEADGYQMCGQYIKIRIQRNAPYGFYLKSNEWVRFLGIHFQGSAKKIMYKYLPFPDRMIFLSKYYYEKFINKIKKLYA